MSVVKGTVHGFASIVMVVLGTILAGAIKSNLEVFETVSELTVLLLIELGNLPISEEIAGILIPVGILMGVWVIVYEITLITNE